MSAVKHVFMLERRLKYLSDSDTHASPPARAEADALRGALPILRKVAAQESKRPHLGYPCEVCRTAAGFICSHLPSRT